MKKFPERIAILGVGLIGGSIALGLKLRLASKITILGLCSDPKRAKLAKERGVIDRPIFKLADIPKNTDLVIIATPILAILKILPQLEKKVSNNCLIIDVGSTKETILRSVESNFPNLSFIGTHPMAGSDLSGFENADSYLFQNKPWIVCPPKNIKKEKLEIVEELIKILGAKMTLMTARQHDKTVAFASHLFLALGSILVSVNTKQAGWNQIAEVSSTGFRDTTRLASHNPRVKTEIILTNKKNIVVALSDTKREIDFFLKLIKDHPDKLFSYFQNTKTLRDNWLLQNFS